MRNVGDFRCSGFVPGSSVHKQPGSIRRATVGTALLNNCERTGSSAMQKRRRFKQTETLEERLAAEAADLRNRAQGMRPGAKRQQLLRRAKQWDMGSRMSEWLRCPVQQIRKSP